MILAMFCMMGLKDSLEKIKAMVCTPGFIWGKWGDMVYKKRLMGEGATFREQNKRD